jgi:two-component system sensor histidine kinase PhoQ
MPVARSLRARVLVWVSVALTVLFALTVYGLDLALKNTIDRSRQALLQAQIDGLIALANSGADGQLTLPQESVNPQFLTADSGLYGLLWDEEGYLVWESDSLVGRRFPEIDLPPPGESRFLTIDEPGLPPLEALVFGTHWVETDTNYTFGTAVSLEPYEEQQASFRRNIVSWFAGVTVIMLVVVTGVLGWVMRPVRRLAVQVSEVERGRRRELSDAYPTELEGLAANLNVLIDTERRRLARYRNTLDDLAHSLKTPLAAMRALLGESADRAPSAEALDRELDRMDQRISYQLRRARASGSSGIGAEPTALAPIVADLILTLDKVYADKAVRCESGIEPGAVFHGDPGDLTEILGNLLENAYKYCASAVRVIGRTSGNGVIVTVEDDGPGIEAHELELLLERGKRADETLPGQGIGLAVVRETAELYAGELSVAKSSMGGAAVTVKLSRAGDRSP